MSFLRARSPVTPKITSPHGPAIRGRRRSPGSRRGLADSATRGLERLARGRDDGLGRDAELLEQGLVVRRGTVVLERDRPARVAHDLVPRQRKTRLDRDTRLDRRGQDRLAVGLVLLGEPLEARGG